MEQPEAPVTPNQTHLPMARQTGSNHLQQNIGIETQRHARHPHAGRTGAGGQIVFDAGSGSVLAAPISRALVRKPIEIPESAHRPSTWCWFAETRNGFEGETPRCPNALFWMILRFNLEDMPALADSVFLTYPAIIHYR